MVVLVTHHSALHRGPSSKHPEMPERVSTILEKFSASKLLSRCRELHSKRLATDEELLRVHTPGHLARVAAATKAVQEQPSERALREPQGDGAVYYHEATEESARCAAGSTLDAVEAALRGEARSAFALVRPPGHHAESDRELGFCFYNNAAVAAAAARHTHGLARVAILDWDVHHGNGTQEIFEADPSVLFISLHRYGKGFFPGTGAAADVGTGAGVGRTVNLPWIQAGLGDSDYEAGACLYTAPLPAPFILSPFHSLTRLSSLPTARHANPPRVQPAATPDLGRLRRRPR